MGRLGSTQSGTVAVSKAIAHGLSLAVRVAAGTLLFVLVLAAVSTQDARVAGMMLTFPALNGISLMMAPVPDRRAMARAMLAVIALNGIVALLFIAVLTSLEARHGSAAVGWIWPVSGAAFLVWLLACAGLAAGRRGAETAFVLAFIIAAPLLAAAWWEVCPQLAAPAATGALDAMLRHNGVRIALFATTLGLLLVAAEWLGAGNTLLGRLGAFPLLPLFSLATIAGSAGGTGISRLLALRPAILLGLLLAMAFAWVYSGYLMRLARRARRPGRWWMGALAGLLGGWTACAALIWGGMALVAHLERCG